MKFTNLFLIYYIFPFIGIYCQSSIIDLNEQLSFNYDNGGKIFVTNNYEYNKKYYINDEYIYSVVNNNENSCLDSCFSWMYEYPPIDDAIAIIGFDVRYINEKKCECKGQMLRRRKFQYYPHILKIDKYNKKYYYESDLVKMTYNRGYFTNIYYAQYMCNEYLLKYARSNNAEAITKYNILCDNTYCECSANLLFSY
jgi:hypothetical protein